MANITTNSTSNSSYEKMSPLPASECIPWLVVLITECLAIVILNIITIIVFVKQRQLQRRSTYLIIHLAIVDLLVGAVSGPLNIYSMAIGNSCGLWEAEVNSFFQYSFYYILTYMLPFTSLTNLATISLERLHAIFRPFRHRAMKKWVYGISICAIWITVILCESAEVVWDIKFVLLLYVMHCLYYGICLFVICVSCAAVVIKVRYRSIPRHHGAAAARERKLTATLFMVAFASLLTWLPHVIFSLSVIVTGYKIVSTLSRQTNFHIRVTLTVLSFGNSLVNPIVYALRMPGFRMSVSKLFRKARNERITPADLSLRNL